MCTGQMQIRCFVFAVTISMLSHQLVDGATKDDSAPKRLSDHLESNYGSTSIRPVVNASKSVETSFRVLVSQVIEFDERKQYIMISAWRREDWIDEFLQWDPEDYGGLESITYDHNNLWKPDINLIENVDRDYIGEFDSDVIVTSNGSVTWYTPILTTSMCKVGVRYFPFDQQVCNLTFMSWAYDASGIDLYYTTDDDANQNIFIANGVWSIINVTARREEVQFACCKHPYIQIIYTLTLERSYTFYVLNIVLPSGLLAFLNCLVFLLPPGSGERLQFAVSNLLAVILFQQLVGGIMPPLGDELPLIGMFFVYMIITNCFVLGMTIMILRFYHQRGDKEVHRLLRRISFVKRAGEGNLKRHERLNHLELINEPYLELSTISSTMSNRNGTSRKSVDLDARAHEVINNGDATRETENRQWMTSSMTSERLQERNKEEWKMVARVVDKYLCVFIAVLTVIVIISLVCRFSYQY